MTYVPNLMASYRVFESNHDSMDSSATICSRPRPTTIEDRKSYQSFLMSVEDSQCRRALESLNTIKWVSLLIEDNVDAPTFDKAAHFLRPKDYEDDVLVERHASGLCGYPLCSKPPLRAFSNVPQFKLTHSAQKLVDLQHLGRFCSNACFKSSEAYRQRLMAESSSGSRKTPPARHVDGHLLPRCHATPLPSDPNQPIMINEDHQQHSSSHPIGHTADKLNSTPPSGPARDPNSRPLQSILDSIIITEHFMTAHPTITSPATPSIEELVQCPKPDSTANDGFLNAGRGSHLEAHCWKTEDDDDDDDDMLSSSSELQKVIRAHSMLASSQPRAFLQRRHRPQLQPLLKDRSENIETLEEDLDTSLVGCDLESGIVYDVDCEEDQLAIDLAMHLRQQLESST